MWIFGNTFYDKHWNFDNSQLIKLLEEARKLQNKQQKKQWSIWNKDIVLFKSVSKKEVWQLINKLSIFVNSWIDIKWALWIIAKQIKNPYLKDIVIEIKENIDHWIAINETIATYPKVFDTLTIALIKVWEKTWKLGLILNELDTQMIENLELKGKVKGAMIYPMILLTLTIAMVVFMMIFIVPRVTAAFAKAWAKLPRPTQIVVNISDFLWGFTQEWKNIKFDKKNNSCSFEKFWNNYVWTIVKWKSANSPDKCHVWSQWIKVVFFLIAIFIILKLINKTYAWKLTLSKFATKMPIFWYIVKQSNIVYFIKSFTLLLDSWVLLLEALKTSAQVVPNQAYKKEIIRVKNEVELWLTISKALWLNLEYESSIYMNPLFAEEFAYVVSTWEETWSLSESLKKIWTNYNNELKRYIWNLSAMMEPLIIVIVWFLVWSIVISIMMPFFEMWKIAKNL